MKNPHSILTVPAIRSSFCRACLPWLGYLLCALTLLALSRAAAKEMIEKRVEALLELSFDLVLTREDAPPKPDPAGLTAICRAWQVRASDVLFVGDFQLDLLAGRRAGITTVLYAPDGPPAYAREADFVVAHLSEIWRVVSELDGRA